MKMIDLSLPLREDRPCWWPGNPPFVHTAVNVWYGHASEDVGSDAGNHLNGVLRMDEHTGTHCDASAHFLPPGDPDFAYLGQLSVDRFCGETTVIDVPPGSVLDVESLAAYEERAGEEYRPVVLLRTGWSERYDHPSADDYVGAVVEGRQPCWPTPSVEALRHLAEHGVRVVGTDCPSIAAPTNAEDVHAAGFRAGLVFVECLTNLEAVMDGDLFIFLPLALGDASGSPGRAVAIRALSLKES